VRVLAQIKAEEQRFAPLGIQYEVWGPEGLYARLRTNRDAVRRFLGEIWLHIVFDRAAPNVKKKREAASHETTTAGRDSVVNKALTPALAHDLVTTIEPARIKLFDDALMVCVLRNILEILTTRTMF
jgi:hypothetical protein